MSDPGRWNFMLVAGDTFPDVVTVSDSDGVAIDLSAGACRFDINSAEDGSGTILVDVTDADYIALGADGTITFSIPTSVTSILDFTVGYHNLVITLSSVVETLLHGEVTLQKRNLP